MMYWVEYSDNGKIAQSSSGIAVPRTGFTAPNVLETASLVRDDLWFVEGGMLMPIPPKPNVAHVFDYATKTWIDPRTLEDHRAEAWARIKSVLDQIEFAPFSYKGYLWDGDQTAQRRLGPIINISRDKLAQNEPFYYSWKTYDNQMITLEAQDFINMQLAKVQQFGNAFQKAETLRNQINQATTIQELDAVKWE